MYFVFRYVGFSIDVKDTLKTIVATGVMGVVVLLSYDAVMTYTFHNTLATMIAIVCGAAVYGVMLLLVGGVSSRDVEKVPRIGQKLAALLRKLGLLRR